MSNGLAAVFVPPWHQTVNVGSGDVTFDPPLKGIVCNIDGDIVLTPAQGGANVTYKMIQGQTIIGRFTAVIQTGTSATANSFIAVR